MYAVLRDVGLSVVGRWVLPHDGTILQTDIRYVDEKGYCIFLMNPCYVGT